MGHAGSKRVSAEHGQRQAAGLVACLLSLGIHIAVFHILSTASFDLPLFVLPDRRTPEADASKAFTLLRREWQDALRWPDEGRADDGGMALDIEREVEHTARRLDPALMEPPATLDDHLAGDAEAIAEPSAVPERQVWEPRQEILMIEKDLLPDEVGPLARRTIPSIRRVAQAPDVALPIETTWLDKRGEGGLSPRKPDAPATFDIAERVVGGWGGRSSLRLDQGSETEPSRMFPDKSPETRRVKPIENFLKADVSVYSSFRDRHYGYFKIEIRRAGAEVLPVLSKDILLVQDCSASMTEQRLFFCRQGLERCLSILDEKDRFNMASFRDSTAMCFPGWVDGRAEHLDRARAFIRDMTAGGNTDIFASMKELMAVERQPGRPVIVLLFTDGCSTIGLTRSSDIIGEFSKLNDGAISVFSLGTVQTANRYLIDLLSYCNRGDATVVATGRWGIPDAVRDLMKGVSRPVLSDLRFRFSGGRDVEVYPELTSNLYQDRALVLYGRYRRGTKHVVVQAMGRAGDAVCDMVFNIGVDSTARAGSRDIREGWARQKIYGLIGGYARTGQQSLLDEVWETARSYGVEVPHRRDLRRQ